MRWLFLLIALALGGIYWQTLAEWAAWLERPELADWLASQGAWAALISFSLMVAQAVLAPLPAFVLSLANGQVFGALWGGLLSLAGGLAGAQLCYELARL